MAVRIRKDGRVLCAAMHPVEEGDCYINDGVHYALSVEAKVLVTESHERHKEHGEWWWINAIPPEVQVDEFYLAADCDALTGCADDGSELSRALGKLSHEELNDILDSELHSLNPSA